MKKLLIIAAAALCLAASAANSNNMVLGGFAMTNATDCTWNIGFGALSLGWASGVSQSAFLGIRAGQDASNVRRSVGVGINALRGKADLYHATDINGQFYADESNGVIRIGLDNHSNAVAPLSYSNGQWTVNGNLLVNGNLNMGSPALPTAQPSGFDFYVDANRGDDGFDGRSPVSAKRTIDAALALVSTNGQRICLRAGHYAYPKLMQASTYAEADGRHWFRLVGVDGRDSTFMDGYGDEGATNFMFATTHGMCQLYGITFKNWTSGSHSSIPGMSATRLGPFIFAYFEDCAFADTDAKCAWTSQTGAQYIRTCMFYQCIKYKCAVRNVVASGIIGSGTTGYESPFYNNCELYDSYLSMTRDEERGLCNLSSDTYFFNCYIDAETAHPVCWSIADPEDSLYSCVYINPVATIGRPSNYYLVNQWYNCLIGATNLPPASATANILGSPGEISGGLDPDTLLPNYGHSDWIFYGIDSNEKAMLKKAFAGELITAVESIDTNSVPAAAMLRSAISTMRNGTYTLAPQSAEDIRGKAASAELAAIDHGDEDDSGGEDR